MGLVGFQFSINKRLRWVRWNFNFKYFKFTYFKEQFPVNHFEQLYVKFDPKSDPQRPRSDPKRPPRVSFYQICITGVPGLRPETAQSRKSCSRSSESTVSSPIGNGLAHQPPPPIVRFLPFCPPISRSRWSTNGPGGLPPTPDPAGSAD